MTKSNRNLRGDKLEARLGNYGGRIMRVIDDLPSSDAGRHLKDQLLRCGTAVGAHYAEARNAQSTKDFIHKVSLAAKESRESLYWLRAAHKSGLLEGDLSGLLDEADHIVAILFKSMQTARQNKE